MPKRLGYKTDACMMLIRREVNEYMNEQKKNGLNKSRLVNELLFKWYEHKLCHYCLGGVIHSGNCGKCKAPYVICENPGTKCQDKCFPFCGEKQNCTWDELYG